MFQLLGGNVTSRDHPIEKLFRDAEAALIEDGENCVPAMRLGLPCQQLYAEGSGRSCAGLCAKAIPGGRCHRGSLQRRVRPARYLLRLA